MSSIGRIRVYACPLYSLQRGRLIPLGAFGPYSTFVLLARALYSSLLPRLPLCLRPRRYHHRNHPKHRLQKLPRRLLLLLPLPRWFHLGRHDPHPLLRGRSTTLNITINSFNSDLSKEERAKLFPNIGRLFPEWNNQLAKADEIDQVRMVCENAGEYRQFFSDAGAHEALPTGTTQAAASSPNS
ncbi:hypothetical protein BT96DRAFT_260169 [Gymnopus androsaceus JB14]|uniref:Uncharacterized protein n=1 Tax=Gymnopus androsaceus JB14 TaxID=1447944 RepID=A0A6A4H3Y3_9AGAR|nr:hypothetical protein BT96DRAFT_260169 [Gymnopus androsaceus JB14]